MYISLLQKLPIAIAGLFLLIACLTIYFRSKNVTRSEFWKTLKSARHIYAWVLVVVIALTGVFGVFNHIKSKQFVSAVVALNYSEASQAQNSNGTRYNMNEIVCDEVVARAIEMGAFQNVTVGQLKNCLVVYPYMQGDVNDKSSYHISTEFVVEYYASKHTQHLDAENVVKMITGAYKEYYIEKYTDNFRLLTPEEKPDFSTMEYMDIVSYLDKEAAAVQNYLYGMANQGPSFVTSNNTTFHSIAGKVHQYRETQIGQNLRSLILQYGVVKDKASYIDRLSYQNTNTDFERQKNDASYGLCNEAIDMYAEEMTRVVLVPTWDQSGKYYMGRTKVGIDELSVKATSFSDVVATNEKTINENDLIIEKIKNASTTEAAIEEVNNLITAIDKSIDDFTVEAVSAGREYSNYRMNQCIAVSISDVSLFSELKTVLVFCAFAYVSFVLYAVAKKFPKS